MERKTIFTLMGVVFIYVAPCTGIFHQSEADDVNGQPIEELRNAVAQTRIATPEVVLQLKYEQGELNRIYLAQFRKDSPQTVPVVPATNALCADLCHAGLGGDVCGSSCTDMIPVGLATALRSENDSTTQHGQARVHVCPKLCTNQLGIPLCNCLPGEKDASSVVDWEEICAIFCIGDGYVLGGCPPCKEVPQIATLNQLSKLRILNTVDGWVSWCNVQCRQGQGGAACNCDRAPFQ